MKTIKKDPRWRYTCADESATGPRGAIVLLLALLGFAGVFGLTLMAPVHAADAEQKQPEKERDEVKALNEKLQATQEQLRRTTYAAHMNLAQQAWNAHSVARVNELLEQQRPKLGETDLRGFEWHYLSRLSKPELVMEHKFSFNCVAYSPDGKFLATGCPGGKGQPGEVKVWDAETGKILSSFTVSDGWASSLAFSPDGKRLASGSNIFTKLSAQGDVKVWDPQTGKELLSIEGHPGGVKSVVFSPDGKRLATACDGPSKSKPGQVMVWDAQTGKELISLQGHTRGVVSVAFSSDGKWLASSTAPLPAGETKVWDAQSGKELLTLNGGRGSLAFSPDGKRLAGTSVFGLTVWDCQSGQELLSIKDIRGGVSSVAFSPDGKRLATGDSDMHPLGGAKDQGGDVKLWDAQTGQELVTLPAHPGYTGGVRVAFSPDGKHLASVGGKTMKVWELLQNPLILKAGEAKSIVTSVAFSPDGKRLATATSLASATIKNEVKVWDAWTGQELITLDVNARTAVFSPDGKHLATAALRDVKVWDAQSGKELLALEGRSVVAFSPDGKRLATGSPTGGGAGASIRVWDAQTGQDLATFKAPGGPVMSVAFSPDGTLLASTGILSAGFGPGSGLKVWHVQTGKELFTYKLPDAAPSSVVFSPDGKRLASHTNDAVKVWDAQTGAELLTLKGHARVSCVAFSPDGKRLASTASDKTVKLWDAQTGQELLTLEGHDGNANSVAFSPDGHRLAAGAPRGTVRIWDATPLPEKR